MLERTVIVLPTYNESGNMPSLLGDLGRHCPGADLVTMDCDYTDWRFANLIMWFGWQPQHGRG